MSEGGSFTTSYKSTRSINNWSTLLEKDWLFVGGISKEAHIEKKNKLVSLGKVLAMHAKILEE